MTRRGATHMDLYDGAARHADRAGHLAGLQTHRLFRLGFAPRGQRVLAPAGDDPLREEEAQEHTTKAGALVCIAVALLGEATDGSRRSRCGPTATAPVSQNSRIYELC